MSGPVNQAAHGNRHRREKIRDLQYKADVVWVMNSPAGRRFVAAILFECPGRGGCDLLGTYPASDSGLYRHEGRRQVGEELLRMIQEQCPDQYVLMMQECTQAERLEQQLCKAEETTPNRSEESDG